MMELFLDYASLGKPFSIRSEGEVVFGESRLTSLKHRMLKHHILWNNERVLYTCLERGALDDTGSQVEFCEHRDAFRALRQHVEEHENAAVWCELYNSQKSPHITIYTNHNPNTALYVAVTYATTVISWSLSSVISKICALALDEHYLARKLMLHSPIYGTSTLFSNVYRIPISSRATIANREIRISGVDIRPQTAPRALSSSVPHQEVLFDRLVDTLARRHLSAEATACEISGGLDSSVCALAANMLLPDVKCSSIYVDGRSSKNQSVRQAAIARQLNAKHTVLDANLHLPFSRQARGARPLHMNYLTEPFYEAFFELGEHIKRDGADTLISGVGGNEAFPEFPSDVAFENRIKGLSSANERPEFITRHAYEISKYSQETPSHLFSYHASAVQAVESRNERLFSQGIWPINPFLERDVIQFSSSLPYHMRRGRDILKKILLANNLSEFSDDITLSFEDAALAAFFSAADLFEYLCAHSVCHERRLVDSHALGLSVRALDGNMKLGEREMQIVYHAIVFMQIEIILQQCKNISLLS